MVVDTGIHAFGFVTLTFTGSFFLSLLVMSVCVCLLFSLSGSDVCLRLSACVSPSSSVYNVLFCLCQCTCGRACAHTHTHTHTHTHSHSLSLSLSVSYLRQAGDSWKC